MPVILIGLVVFLSLMAYVLLSASTKQRHKYVQRELGKIDEMSGAIFEQYMAWLLENCGYTQVEVTQESGDYGADIIACAADKRIAVQCKRSGAQVGVKAVQEILGGLRFYDCESGVVVTNSYFTRPAQELAAKSQIELWDRDTLAQLIGGGKTSA